MKQLQEAPFCVGMELTEGCNLFCNFCGLQAIRKGPGNYKFLTVKDAELTALKIEESGWTSRLELAMRGEPTMNPNYKEIIKIFAQLPNPLLLISNGGGLKCQEDIDYVMQYLNCLILDNYEYTNIVPKILSWYKGEVSYYPEDISANPHKRRKKNQHDIVVVEDISKATKGNHSRLNNYAGSAFPPNDKAKGKVCALPFRQLTIWWNLKVAMCCNDWRGIYDTGSIRDQSLEEIWQNKYFHAARQKLFRGERDFAPCKGCDVTSYRPGLLPDKKGQGWVDKPDDETHRIIKEATGGDPMALVVLRPWEKS